MTAPDNFAGHTPGPFRVVQNNLGRLEIEREFPCINGLSAWFCVATIWSADEGACGYTDGALSPDQAKPTAALFAAAPTLLAENQRLRAQVVGLREALEEGRRAIGDHFAPNDCYATGPATGNPYRDLVQCPACSFIAMYEQPSPARRTGQQPRRRRPMDREKVIEAMLEAFAPHMDAALQEALHGPTGEADLTAAMRAALAVAEPMVREWERSDHLARIRESVAFLEKDRAEAHGRTGGTP